MAKNTGEIITQQANTVPQDLTPQKKAVVSTDPEAEARKAFEYDNEPVRGVFRRHDGQTDPLEFTYKKHKWDKVTKYKLFHGQVHTIPRGVAIHLNDECKTPIYGSLKGMEAADAASRETPIVGYTNRFSFSSLDFSGRVDVDSRIIPVTDSRKQVIV